MGKRRVRYSIATVRGQVALHLTNIPSSKYLCCFLGMSAVVLHQSNGEKETKKKASVEKKQKHPSYSHTNSHTHTLSTDTHSHTHTLTH